MHTSEAKYNSVKSMLALSSEYTHDKWGRWQPRRWGFCPCLDPEVNVPLLQGCSSKGCNIQNYLCLSCNRFWVLESFGGFSQTSVDVPALVADPSSCCRLREQPSVLGGWWPACLLQTSHPRHCRPTMWDLDRWANELFPRRETKLAKSEVKS